MNNNTINNLLKGQIKPSWYTSILTKLTRAKNVLCSHVKKNFHFEQNVLCSHVKQNFHFEPMEEDHVSKLPMLNMSFMQSQQLQIDREQHLIAVKSDELVAIKLLKVLENPSEHLRVCLHGNVYDFVAYYCHVNTEEIQTYKQTFSAISAFLTESARYFEDLASMIRVNNFKYFKKKKQNNFLFSSLVLNRINYCNCINRIKSRINYCDRIDRIESDGHLYDCDCSMSNCSIFNFCSTCINFFMAHSSCNCNCDLSDYCDCYVLNHINYCSRCRWYFDLECFSGHNRNHYNGHLCINYNDYCSTNDCIVKLSGNQIHICNTILTPNLFRPSQHYSLLSCNINYYHWAHMMLMWLLQGMAFIIEFVKIDFLSLNAHHCKAAMNNLDNAVNELERYIICLCEPYYSNSGLPSGINNGTTYSSSLNPRAAINISSNINSWKMNNFSSRDITTICMKMKQITTCITSVYCAKDKNKLNIPPELPKLIQECKRKGQGLIICMDSNAHSAAWSGQGTTDPAGVLIEDLIFNNDLVLNNEGFAPTFQVNHKKSCIDLTLSSFELQYSIVGWRVNEDFNFSDHNTIHFTLETPIDISKPSINVKKCKWDIFTSHINHSVPFLIDENSCDTQESFDKFAQEFDIMITTALQKSCPPLPNTRRKLKSWWTKTLTDLYTKVNEKKATMNLDEASMAEFKDVKKTYVKEILKAKKEAWEVYCTEIDKLSETSRLVKIMSNGTQQPIGNMKKSDGVFTNDPEETLDLLMETHFPESKKNVRITTENPQGTWFNGKLRSKLINLNDLKNAISDFGNDKSPGSDNITPRTLKNLPDCALNVLITLCKCSMANTYSPKCWRRMNVVFLAKPGKETYATPKSYRPITLSNFTLKTLEKLYKYDIVKNIIDNPLQNQHGFLKGKSCESALSTVVNKIEHAILQKKSCLGVFLDISGAFDNVDFDSVKRILTHRNIDPRITNWYDHLLRNREITGTINGAENIRQPIRGTPQGGVLSAIIWILVNQELLDTFKTGAVVSTGLADDTCLLMSGIDENILIEHMQKAIDKVCIWGRKEGLTFNASKTAIILFTKKKILTSKLRKLTLNGDTIEYVKQTKYLGITFTHNLNWKDHIMSKVASCKRNLMAVKKAIGNDWGLSPQKMSWIWQSIVRPKLIYGAVIWAEPTTIDSGPIKDALNRLQRLALSMVCGSMKSTPLVSMEIILSIPPLPIYIKEVSLLTRLRNRDSVKMTWDGITTLKRNGHLHWCDKVLENIIPTTLPLDKHHSVTKIYFNTSTTAKMSYEPSVINVYTDGSLKNDTSGSGWNVIIGNRIIKTSSEYLGFNVTVQQAEVSAINSASIWLNRAQETENINNIVIYSDSMGALKALSNRESTSKTVIECQGNLNNLARNYSVTLQWIKGHSDIPGNDLADELAKKGVTRAIGPGPFLPLTIQKAKPLIHEYFLKMWKSEFANSEVKHTKGLVQKINVCKDYHQKIVRYSRIQLRTIIGWVTGHNKLNKHMNVMGRSDTQACRLCWDPTETASHLLRQCKNLDHIREGYANNQQRGNRNFVWKRNRQGPVFTIQMMDLHFTEFVLNMEREWTRITDQITGD